MLGPLTVRFPFFLGGGIPTADHFHHEMLSANAERCGPNGSARSFSAQVVPENYRVRRGSTVTGCDKLRDDFRPQRRQRARPQKIVSALDKLSVKHGEQVLELHPCKLSEQRRAQTL